MSLAGRQPSSWFRLVRAHILRKKAAVNASPLVFPRTISTSSHVSPPTNPHLSSPALRRHLSTFFLSPKELLIQVEKERQNEREERLKAGLDTADIDAEEEEDYMGVGPLIEKLGKETPWDIKHLYRVEEPTDSESDHEEWSSTAAKKKRVELFEEKCKRHEEMINKFVKSETLDESFKWMNRIDKFKEKHLPFGPEYRVMGELINRLRVATGKDKFILQLKLNRAIKLVERKEMYDPNNPANYGTVKSLFGGYDESGLEGGAEKQKGRAALDDSDDEEFDDIKEKDNELLTKLDAIDKKLEEKLAVLEHTFGRRGLALEEEIRDLAEERNSYTEKKRRPLYRKGFDVKLINLNRTTKVTKGGRQMKQTALVVCGNYNGVIGYAKGKGPAADIAFKEATEKCFQNLHYVERYEDHTIAHAIQTTYKKTKVCLWPARTRSGISAGKHVYTILRLAGIVNVKSKVIGSRNPHNTVKAVFKALNAIETPKDVQEKFGRTVVPTYLLPR